MRSKESLEKEIERYVKEKGVVFISDIARKFGINFTTASDIVKDLERREKIKIEDKGVAKLVIYKEGDKNE